MKKLLLIICLMPCLLLYAQEEQGKVTEQANGHRPLIDKDNIEHAFFFSLRGGYASFMPKLISVDNSRLKGSAGYDAMFDFQYTFFFKPYGRIIPPYFLGVSTGLSFGYAESGIKGVPDYFLNTVDIYGNQVDYHIYADDMKEHTGQFLLEIPILFSFYYKGLMLNTGFKLDFPFVNSYRSSLTNLSIDAKYPKYIDDDTYLHNALITGCPPAGTFKQKGTWNGSVFNFLYTVDLGYLWKIKFGQIGLGAYFDIALYNTFQKKTAYTSFVDIEQIGARQVNNVVQPPQVRVQPATQGFAQKVGYFDVGIKLTYTFGYYELTKTQDAKDSHDWAEELK